MMNVKKILGLVILAGIIGTGIFLTTANRPSQQNGSLKVTTTFYPLYEFSRAVAGDLATVTNITPAGAEPHDFEPSPQQLIAAQKSQVFIYNGASFEPWAEKFLPDYKNVAVKTSAGLPLIAMEDAQDPHFWLDPVLAQGTIDAIANGLIAAAPQHKDTFVKNATAYKARLAALDTDFTSGLATCQKHTIVASHDAFSYIGKRYNFEIMAITGISPDEEPSPAKLAEISQAVRQQGIGYIFFESLVSPRLADTIATETGAKTAALDPIEGLSDEDQKQGKNYLSVQRQNLAALRTALGCQ
ncbi:MAG TPA: zinc ABC transporter substrate-binding protein [Candidatus Saccharimonadales bacterium]|nr:zinc ABC transporter substrate-binding protein [Candidatus Saccharimonadales bacterium]